MDWKEFVVGMVGEMLSWPVVVLVVILILLKPLRKLIGRVRTAKGFGGEVEFQELLEDAEESILDAEPTDLPGSDVLSGETGQILGTSTGDLLDDPFDPDPSRDPSGAIMVSWQTLATALFELRAATAGRGRPTKNPRIVLGQLRSNDAINAKFYDAAQNLLALRNQVAHGEAVPTPGAARNYVDLAHQLLMTARGLTAMAQVDLESPLPPHIA